jgi:hypothetical protein
MSYKEMLEDAKAKGLTSEKVMWESIDDVEEMLAMMKAEHPEHYWKMLRKMHGRIYHHHYTEDFARHDVGKMHWTDKQGQKHEGGHWTVAQIEEATKTRNFPTGTTRWDKYVAYNAFYSDLCKELDDEAILKAAFLFWFADEDRGAEGKIWRYFCH